MRALVAEVLEEEGATGRPDRHDDRAAARGGRAPTRSPTHADFFSFGTNDLTQMTFGVSPRRRRGQVPAGVRRGAASSRRTRSRPSTSTASAQLVRMGCERGRGDQAGAQARRVRRARRRSRVDRVLPRRRARLRVVLAVPRADRPGWRRRRRHSAAGSATADGDPRAGRRRLRRARLRLGRRAAAGRASVRRDAADRDGGRTRRRRPVLRAVRAPRRRRLARRAPRGAARRRARADRDRRRRDGERRQHRERARDLAAARDRRRAARRPGSAARCCGARRPG